MKYFLSQELLQADVFRQQCRCIAVLIICCLTGMGMSNTAFAQYWNDWDNQPASSQRYSADLAATDSGGGTWGDILRMSVQIEGSTARFNIKSKKGNFYNTNSVNIRSGSQSGTVLVSGKITPGSEVATLRLNLDTIAQFPHRFYGTVTNNVGHAWVGYVQISRNGVPSPVSDPPVPAPTAPAPRPNTAPNRPLISNAPAEAEVNMPVNIPVTAGRGQGGEMVQVQCTATGSASTPDNPYRSDWVYAGYTVTAEFRFQSAGSQTIFCNTLDRYGATSSLNQRTIIISGRRDFTTPPPVVKAPDHALPNKPVTVSLVAGEDPSNRDLVRISCEARDSNRTAGNPYLSDWLPPGAESKAKFTFFSEGMKEISCTSHSRQGFTSSSNGATVMVRPDNHAPGKPEISSYPYDTQTGHPTSIPITAGSDSDGDQVKVECTTENTSIAGNTPYTSDWIASGSTVNAVLTFYATGNREFSCITVDRKDARSDESRRTINVQRMPIRPNPISLNRPNQAQANCSCQKKNPSQQSWPQQSQQSTSSCAVCKTNRARQGGISFNEPYIPNYTDQYTSKNQYNNYTDHNSRFSAPPPPDLQGRVAYSSNGAPVYNAQIKAWDLASGLSYTATTDYNGYFSFNLDRKNLTCQIQASKGAFTSSIKEVRISSGNPAEIDLTIMDRTMNNPAMQQQMQWPKTQPPASNKNNVWQFN
ncbi:MAG: carboxypeptidase-like regulatory domain-containing protein [Candidatus Electrothrix sp. YB6]